LLLKDEIQAGIDGKAESGVEKRKKLGMPKTYQLTAWSIGKSLRFCPSKIKALN
jgi:hypothetical protein